jgi:hypothetical protein
VDDAEYTGPDDKYSSVQDVVLERVGELIGMEVDWDESGLEVTPPADDVELPRDGALPELWATDEVGGEFPVPVGRIEEVAFAVTKGALDVDPNAPAAVLDDRGSDVVPVGPT